LTASETITPDTLTSTDLSREGDPTEQLRQQLADRNQELADLGYAISHDLNEPLRKLMSFSNLLLEDMDQEELNEQASKDLQFIVDAAERMRDLVQGLSSWSRACRRAMKMQSACLQTCADRAINHLKEVMDQCEPEIDFDSLPTIIGDLEMLVGLYEHLLDNALKFRGDAKPVIRFTAVDHDDYWVLGVQDNGIGINPHYIDRIFQPFQRLHGRSKYEGNGIGLAICKKTVARHQGRIWVESEPGKGSRFYIALPVDNKTKSTKKRTLSESMAVT